jgi:YegS/Rv2252/BmrU family lipid kinase
MSIDNKVLFIINKYSGTGYSADLEGEIITQCESRNLECIIEFTKARGHGIAIARKAVEQKFKMVFAVGGDGTVNEVVQGLLHSNIPLGIIPKGSGNGLARHLQIPLKVSKALSLLDLENVVAIDTFTVNDQLSVNVSGIGFDGHVAGLFGKDGKRGLFHYGKLVVNNFIAFKEFDYELVLDGTQSKNSSFIISIANSSQFGNNASIAPHASLCDQMLDICLVKKLTVFQGLVFAYRLFNKTLHQSNDVKIHKAKVIEVRTQKDLPYHIDGEPAGTSSHFRIKTNPASLLVAIPKQSKSI